MADKILVSSRQSIYGFALMIVVFIIILFLFISITNVLNHLHDYRSEVDAVNVSWLHLKAKIAETAVTMEQTSAEQEWLESFRLLDEKLGQLTSSLLFSTLVTIYPELEEYWEHLADEWTGIKAGFLEIRGMPVNKAANKQFISRVKWLFKNSGRFEQTLIDLAGWIQLYNGHQIRAFQVLLYFLGAAIIISVFLAIGLRHWISLQEKLLVTAINSMPDAVIITDRFLKVVYSNPQANIMLVKKKEEIHNKKIAQVLTLEDCEGRQINITGRGEEGSPEPALAHIGDLFLRNRKGKTIPVSIRVSPVREKRDFSRGSIFVIRDLTDWRMLMVSMSVYFLSMAPEDMDNAVLHVLEKIRNFLDADFSCVLQFSGKGREMEVTHLQSSKQAGSMDLAAFINHEQDEYLFQKLANFETVIVSNRSELSTGGHIQCYIISPMVNTGVLIGMLFLGSVNHEKNWPEDIGELLEITEEMIVNLLERKWSKKELARLDTELHMMFDRANVPIFVVDTGGRIIVWNSNIEQITGCSNSDAVGKDFLEHFIMRENRKSMEKMIEDVLHSRETQTLEAGFHTAGDGDAVILLNCFPRYNQDGEIIGAIGIGQDITVRKQAELRNQVLTQALINAQEKERQRISLELHDRVAQLLSTARISAETTGALKETTPEIKENITEISTLIMESISVVRELAYALHPPCLDQLGLVQSLAQFCDNFTDRSGINVDFYASGADSLSLKADMAIHLYRITQEGLNNIRKHAETNSATVRLVASHPHLILQIEDRGKGFDLEKRASAAIREKRMGLQGMAERTELLNGTISVKSQPGKGTIIRVMIPYITKG